MSEITKGKNSKELIKLLFEKKNALQVFRLGNAGSKTKNVKEGKGIRKDIARIMTELTVLQRAADVAAVAAAPAKLSKAPVKVARAQKFSRGPVKAVKVSKATK